MSVGRQIKKMAEAAGYDCLIFRRKVIIYVEVAPAEFSKDENGLAQAGEVLRELAEASAESEE